MAYVGEGLDAPALEQNVDIAQLQAAAQGASVALQVALPEVGFVGSLNGLTGLLTLQAGSSATGVTVVVSSDGLATLSVAVLGITAPGVAKSNIAAIAPVVTNDEFEGYAPFSIWINTAVPEIYMCTSAATAAAVWLKISP